MAAAFRTAVRDRFAATLIRTTRKSAGLSQRALAARAGTSQPAVSLYESGASSPSVATLDRGLFPLARLRDERAVLLGEWVDVVPQDVFAPPVAKNALAEAVPL
jgi:predicted transcriptional regulator